MTQQITKPNPITTLRTMLEQAAPKLQAVAPKHLKVERLTRLMLAAASNTPAILNCTPESVLQFCLTCSATGLEPIGAGGIWPIPFSTKLTAIIDYRGMVNVAKRAGCIKADLVRLAGAVTRLAIVRGLDHFVEIFASDAGDKHKSDSVRVIKERAEHFVFAIGIIA